jgi:hypothetical protein
MEPNRQLPRLKKSLAFLLPDGWQGEVVDLSAIGMRVQSLVLLPEGTEVKGTLMLPGSSPLPIQGKVVWSQAPDHENRIPAEMGLELTSVSEPYLEAVAKLFAE